MLFVEDFLKYIAIEKRLSKHTYTAYEIDLKQFGDYLKKYYELEQPQEADFQMIRSWVASMVEQKLNPRTVNRKIATLRAFFSYLTKRKALAIDPMQRMVSLKTDKPLPAFVEQKAMDLLFEEIDFGDDFEGLRDRLVLEILYGTGIRLAELLGLNNADVNHFDRTIKVLGKRNKQRIVPLHPILFELLEKYLLFKNNQFKAAELTLIVTEKGESAYPMLIQRIVKKHLSAVTSLSKKSPHVLRHTFATHLLNEGAELNSIKELLGHSSLAATQIYTHNSIEKLKNVFKKAHPKA